MTILFKLRVHISERVVSRVVFLKDVEVKGIGRLESENLVFLRTFLDGQFVHFYVSISNETGTIGKPVSHSA